MDFLDYESKGFQTGKFKNADGTSPYVALGSSLLTGIGGFLSSNNDLKAAKAKAEADRAAAEASIQVAKYNAQAAAAQAAAAAAGSTTAKKGMSTGVVVALVVFGLAVVGGGIYLAVKK